MFPLPQVGKEVEDLRKVFLLGPGHSGTGCPLPGVTAAEVTAKKDKHKKDIDQTQREQQLPLREGGRIPASTFPESFQGWPGSGSVANDYYRMQMSMQIPQGSRTFGKC